MLDCLQAPFLLRDTLSPYTLPFASSHPYPLLPAALLITSRSGNGSTDDKGQSGRRLGRRQINGPPFPRLVGGLGYVGYLAGLGPAYYAISVAGAAGHLAWQCITVDFDSRQDCWNKFKANGWLGGLIWLGIAVDYVVEVVLPGKYKDKEDTEDIEA